jgi:glycosyltransferase involved in cell wall biosynthesis
LFFDYKSWIFTRKTRRAIKNETFDVILCSTYYTFPLPTAAKIAKEQNIEFIADLRDIAEEYTESDFYVHSLPTIFGLEKYISLFYKHVSIKRRNKNLKKAKHVTTISPWHVNIISKINPKSTLIFNGFDENVFKPQTIKTEKFTITYTGRIYNLSIRNPLLFFEGIQELLTENPNLQKDLQIEWYVDSKTEDLIRSLSSKYDIEKYTIISPFIPISQIPELLNRSSIVLIVTNKTSENGAKGIMTTKFFEALGCERPILCVRSDEADLEQTINETKAGIAARNTQEIKDFILSKYKEWQAQRFTNQDVDKEKKKQFSRSYQAQQFLKIL